MNIYFFEEMMNEMSGWKILDYILIFYYFIIFDADFESGLS